MRMKIALLGAEGTLARLLLEQAQTEGIRLVPVTLPDNADPQALAEWLEPWRGGALVDLRHADWPALLGEPEVAALDEWQQSCEGLIDTCAAQDCLLLWPSSARVFDGGKPTLWSEKDLPQPVGRLGALQAALEEHLCNAGGRHLILRLSWLLDPAPQAQFGYLLAGLRSGQPLQLAEEWRGNPTPLADAARVLLAMLKQSDCGADLSGIYHYGSSEASSWISLAKVLAQELLASGQIDVDPQILPVAFESQPQSAFEPRNAALSCKRITHVFGIKPRAWRTQLAELVKP